MKKRIVSILTSMLMVFSLSAYVPAVGAGAETAANESTDGVSMDNGEVSVEGTNSFGNMLTDTLSEKIDEQQENNGCNVFSVEMTDTKTAQVKFETLQDCTLLVGIYDENGEKMLASGSTEVTAGEKNATVEIETDEMPQYFYVRAFLVDTECLRPLCTAYRSPNYTQRMQEFFAKTIDDFDAEKVYNFDDDKKNNFAVYSDDTIIITKQDGVNEVVTADDENNNYVIENADSSITSLKTGDTFAYEYGDGNVIIVKVANIQICGTTVTITGEDTSLDEVFEYVKIDTEQDTSECEYDPSTAGEGVTYVENDENESEIQTYSVDKTGEATLTKHFDICKNESSEVEDGHGKLSISVNGGIDLSVTASIKLYIDWSDSYLEVNLGTTAEIKLTIEGKGRLSFPLGTFKFMPVAGINITIVPSVVFDCDITIEFSGKLTASFGFKVSKDGMENISESPHLEVEVKAEGYVFIGISIEPEISLISKKIADAELSGTSGVKISGSISTDYKWGKYSERHDCASCISGNASVEISYSFAASLLKKKSLTFDISDTEEFPLGEYYYSLQYRDFGWGECPHKSYNTTIVVYDPFYPVSDADVEIDGHSYTSNKKGKINLYLKNGKHHITANKVLKGMADEYITVTDKAQTFKIKLNKKYAQNILSDVKMVNLGNYHSAAITNDGSLYTWGNNEYGQLGYGNIENAPLPIDNRYPHKIMNNVRSVSLGYDFSAAVTNDGILYIWGCSNGIILDEVDGKKIYNSDKPIKFMNDVKDVQCGYGHIVILKNDGSLYTCGRNTDGELGDGTNDSKSKPVKIMDDVKMISAGGANGAAIKENGDLYLWGSDGFSGSLGDDSYGDSNVPLKIMENVKAVSLGNGHRAAIKNDGSLYIWGDNRMYQIGDGTITNCQKPKILMKDKKFKAVSLGGWSSAAISEDNKLYTWGYNDYGQLGEGTTIDRKTPIEISDNVKYISVGDCYSAAITLDNKLYTWGYNDYGQLGDGTTDDKNAIPTIDKPKTGSTISTQNIETDSTGVSLTAADEMLIKEPVINDGTASFDELLPDEIYNIYAMRSAESEELLGSDNLLYIAQAVSDENGKLTVKYGFTDSSDDPQWVAVPIKQDDISNAEITMDDITYNDEIQYVSPVITFNGKTLTEDKDYYLDGDYAAMAVGEYTVTAHGKGLYKGTISKTYKVTCPISECSIELSSETSYFRGIRIKPVVKIMNGETALKQGTDYTVSYFDNLSVGTARVVITGKGYYTGTTEKTFEIVQRSIANCQVELSAENYYFNGKRFKPTVKVFCNGTEMYSGNYTVTYSNNLSAGTATITLTGKKNLKGTVTKTFKINPRNIANCTVVLTKNSANKYQPTVAVKIGSNAVYSGNYTVKYVTSADKKIVKVTLTGKGNLAGTTTKTYTVA